MPRAKKVAAVPQPPKEPLAPGGKKQFRRGVKATKTKLPKEVVSKVDIAMKKSNQKGFYVGEPFGTSNFDLPLADIAGFCQAVAHDLSIRYPYNFGSVSENTGAQLYPSTVAAYLGLAALEYFRRLGQLSGSTAVTSPTFFADTYVIPKPLYWFLMYNSRTIEAPLLKKMVVYPETDWNLSVATIIPGTSANNWSVLQLPQGSAYGNGFNWFISSNIEGGGVASPGYFARLFEYSNSSTPIQFPWTSWLTGSSSLLADADYMALISRTLMSMEGLNPVVFSTIPTYAPDHSAFCLPIAPGIVNPNWTQATAVVSPNPKFDADLAVVFAPSANLMNRGLFPPLYTDCASMPTWPQFSPNQNPADFTVSATTVMEQNIQTFIWLANNSDRVLPTGKNIPFKRFITIRNGLHIPQRFCKITPRYVDFYGIMQKAMIALIRFSSTTVGLGLAMTADVIGNYYVMVEQAIRAKVMLEGQLDLGRNAGATSFLGSASLTCATGIFKKNMNLFLTTMLNQIGVTKVGGELQVPQINLNAFGAIAPTTSIVNLPQFPFYNTGSNIFNGNIGSGSSGSYTNAFTWFPFVNIDNPINATPQGGLNYWAGACDNFVATATGNAFLPGITTTALATSFSTYTGISGISSFTACIVGAIAQVSAIVDAFGGYFAQEQINNRNILAPVNLRKLGGPGMYSYAVNIGTSPQNSYQVVNALPVTISGAITSPAVQVGVHCIFNTNRAESATAMTKSELALILAYGICSIYRVNTTKFSLNGYTSVILNSLNLNRIYSSFLNELLNTESAAITEFRKNQLMYHGKSTADSLVSKTASALDLDCTRSVLRKLSDFIATTLSSESLPLDTQNACRAGLRLAQTINVPVPGGELWCKAAKSAVAASQSVYHHYKGKNERGISGQKENDQAIQETFGY